MTYNKLLLRYYSLSDLFYSYKAVIPNVYGFIQVYLYNSDSFFPIFYYK
jgi:hypothetical protein